eukprot:3543994-Pleurochrysis_carterae.AAC.1
MAAETVEAAVTVAAETVMTLAAVTVAPERASLLPKPPAKLRRQRRLRRRRRRRRRCVQDREGLARWIPQVRPR